MIAANVDLTGQDTNSSGLATSIRWQPGTHRPVIRDWGQVVRYAFVSGSTWVIDFIIFALLHESVGYLAAMVIARIGGLAFSFPAHRWFSFTSRGPATLREVVSYLTLWLLNLMFATAILAGLSSIGLPHPLLLKAAVEVVVFLVNYVILAIVFGRAKRI